VNLKILVIVVGKAREGFMIKSGEAKKLEGMITEAKKKIK